MARHASSSRLPTTPRSTSVYSSVSGSTATPSARDGGGGYSRTLSERGAASTAAASAYGESSGSRLATPQKQPQASGAEGKRKYARVCKKTFLRGRVSHEGATYTLFLMVTLPTAARSVSYNLFPDTDVRLTSSSIDALTPSGAAPALNASAARAAAHLGLPLGTDTFASSPQDESGSNLPKVSISNFCVCLVMPAMPLVPPDERRGYLVTLHLSASLASQPPRSPYLVKLPVPLCLNNFLDLTLADSMHASGVIVAEVEPPLVRRERRVVAGESAAQEDAHVLAGRFPAAECVAVRWAKQEVDEARRLPEWASRAARRQGGEELSAIQLDRLETQLRLAAAPPAAGVQDGEVALDVELRGELVGPHFAGLELEAALPLALDVFGQKTRWLDLEVTGGTEMLRWLPSEPAAAEDASQAPSSRPASSASSSSSLGKGHPSAARLSDDSLVLEDEHGALMDAAPPRGLNEVDVSFDDGGIDAKDRKRNRRHSIGGASLAAAVAAAPALADAQPTSDSSEGIGAQGVVLIFDIAKLCALVTAARHERFEFQLKGTLVTGASSTPDEARFTMPLLRAPNVEKHSCNISLVNASPDAPTLRVVGRPSGAVHLYADDRRRNGGMTFSLRLSPSSSSEEHKLENEACVIVVQAAPSSSSATTAAGSVADRSMSPMSPTSATEHSRTFDEDMSSASAVSTATILRHLAPLPASVPASASPSGRARRGGSLLTAVGGGVSPSARLHVWLEPPASSSSPDDAALARAVFSLEGLWPSALSDEDTHGSLLDVLLLRLPPGAQVLYSSLNGRVTQPSVQPTQAQQSRSMLELTLPEGLVDHPATILPKWQVLVAADVGESVELPMLSCDVAVLEVEVQQASTLKYAISSPDLLLDSPSATGSTFRAHMLPTMASRVLQLSTPPSPLQQQQTTSLVDLDLPVPRSLDAITPQTIALVPGTQASRSRAKAQTPEPSRATRQRSWLWRFAGLLFALCVALSLLVSVSTLHERLDAVTARLETLSFALEPPQGMWQPPLEPNDDEAQQWNKGAAGNGATHTASPVAPPTRHAGPTPSPPSSLSVLRVVSTPMALLALLLRPFGRLFGMS